MSMPRCKTCKWWGRSYFGVCEFTDTVKAEEPNTRFVIEATASDDTGLETHLHTGPEFGCIHHEEKDQDRPGINPQTGKPLNALPWETQ